MSVVSFPSVSSSSSIPSLSDGASSSSVSSLRPFEHLAVLLPRELWKPDSHATRCDDLLCRAQFTLLSRRHHCRKCGGVFCQPCSSRTTPLLDTANLEFMHPPKGVPLSAFASETSLLLDHRVCNDCYNQLHGMPRRSLPVPAIATAPVPAHTADGSARRRTRRSSTMSSTGPLTPPPVFLPPDLAELATYPLRHPSAICKATGGGRWAPAPSLDDPALRRMPGCAPAYEAEIDEETERRRTALHNPIIVDGAFKMRRPLDRAAVLAQLASSA